MKNLSIILLVLFSCVLLHGAAQPVIGSTEVVKANAGRSTNQALITPLITSGSNVGNFGIESNLYLQGSITAAGPGASSQFSVDAATGAVTVRIGGDESVLSPGSLVLSLAGPPGIQIFNSDDSETKFNVNGSNGSQTNRGRISSAVGFTMPGGDVQTLIDAARTNGIATQDGRGTNTMLVTPMFGGSSNVIVIVSNAVPGPGVMHWFRTTNGALVNPPYMSVNLTNGNVGIRTATPDSLVHVSGTGGSATRIGSWSSDSGYAAISLHGALNAAANYTLKGSPGVATALNSPSGQRLDFANGNTIGMSLSAGNVGIGTTSPSSSLDVTGQIRSASIIATSSISMGTANAVLDKGAGGQGFRFVDSGGNSVIGFGAVGGGSGGVSIARDVLLGWSSSTSINGAQDTSIGRQGVNSNYLGVVAGHGSLLGSNHIVNGVIFQSTNSQLVVQSGPKQRAGNATLVGGTVTVANTSVTANTLAMVSRKSAGGTLGFALTYSVSAGTSFTITATDTAGVLSALDTSVVTYFLIENP